MDDLAIRVENLSKRYRIGLKEQLPETLFDSVVSWLRSPLISYRQLRRLSQFDDGRGSANGSTEDPDDVIWALRNVSFEIRPGEVVGIVGRNGAGKSTLLKILSRITEPTSGRAVINGRVSSLLEVGTGFHPELTGRENVYLNGTVLGMTRAEIDRKFDEIVDFSGVERFIDTPVKRYSSGMQVRLAFAVAAHLEPEILLVDEVLAVGDAEFQKRSLGKMEEMAGYGRTVLFVSHRMEAIRALCGRAMLIDQGKLVAAGNTSDTLAQYYQLARDNRVNQRTGIGNPRKRRGTGEVRFSSVSVVGEDGLEKDHFEIGETVCFRLGYEVLKPVSCLYVAVFLRSGRTMDFVACSKRHAVSERPVAAGETGSFELAFPNPPLRIGEYPLYFCLSDNYPHGYDVIDDLTSPLVIHSSKPATELGHDPARPTAHVELPSTILIRTRSGLLS